MVSWGWGEERTFTYGSDYLDAFQWMGTHDPSAYLSVPAAIRFQSENNWPAVRRQCHELLGQALDRICEVTGLAPLYLDAGPPYHQMAIAAIPLIEDLPAFQSRLYERYRIEIPCLQWRERQFIRLSVQGYNSQADIDGLITALETLLRAP